MSTLAGKKIIIVGGTAGIGLSVAKLSLISLAEDVIVASSSTERVDAAVAQLRALIQEKGLPGKVMGQVLDGRDAGKVQAFVKDAGEIDHLVWTSRDTLRTGFPDIEVDKLRGACHDFPHILYSIINIHAGSFDMRFWSVVAAAQVTKFRPGGSIILTIGAHSPAYIPEIV